jgi:hypothetical protein
MKGGQSPTPKPHPAVRAGPAGDRRSQPRWPGLRPQRDYRGREPPLRVSQHTGAGELQKEDCPVGQRCKRRGQRPGEGERGGEGGRRGEGGGRGEGRKPPWGQNRRLTCAAARSQKGKRERGEGGGSTSPCRPNRASASTGVQASSGRDTSEKGKERERRGRREGRQSTPPRGAHQLAQRMCRQAARERGGGREAEREGGRKGGRRERGGREGRASWQVPGPEEVGGDVVPAERRNTPSIHDVARERRKRRETTGQPVGQTEGGRKGLPRVDQGPGRPNRPWRCKMC